MARFTSALLRLTTAITTANLRKLALALKGSVEPASNYRRIQRFHSDYAVDFRALGRLLVHLLPQQPPYVVVVDRTEWHFGRAPVNVLTVGIAHRRICFPIAFAALPAGGGSSADEQIEVLDRFLRVVEPAQVKAVQVEVVVADREFIGAQWLRHLKARKIPFVVRSRSDRRVGLSRQGPALPVRMVARTLQVGQTRRLDGKRFVYRSDGSVVDVEVVIRRLAGPEAAPSSRFLILATFGIDSEAEGAEERLGSGAEGSDERLAEKALRLYRRRWEIETLFAALKSGGFKLERTRLTRPERVERLIGLLALAFSWSHLVGEKRAQLHGRPRELAHGRSARSLFRYGLDRLQEILLTFKEQPAAFRACLSALRHPSTFLSCT